MAIRRPTLILADDNIRRTRAAFRLFHTDYNIEIRNSCFGLFADNDIQPRLLVCSGAEKNLHLFIREMKESGRRFCILMFLQDPEPCELVLREMAGWQVECLPPTVGDDVLFPKMEFYLKAESGLNEQIFLNREIQNELNIVQNNVLETLRLITEYRDSDTGRHMKRTGVFVRLLCDEMIYRGAPISAEYAEMMVKGAALHDIGKIAISDLVLLKPDRFNKSERDIIQLHVLYGEQIINSIISHTRFDDTFKVAREMIATHHEKWDGTGYPRGLKGEGIAVSGRIMALADVYDALRNSRTYKSAMPHNKAADIIFAERGYAFDPAVVDAFLSVNGAFNRVFNTE